MFLNSGMNREIGSVRRTLPSSIIISVATPTTGFVIDMMRNIAFVAIGFFASISINPCASRCAMRPLRATRVTAPEKLPASRWRWIKFGDSFQTFGGKANISGFAFGACAASGIDSSVRMTMRVVTDFAVKRMVSSTVNEYLSQVRAPVYTSRDVARKAGNLCRAGPVPSGGDTYLAHQGREREILKLDESCISNPKSRNLKLDCVRLGTASPI